MLALNVPTQLLSAGFARLFWFLMELIGRIPFKKSYETQKTVKINDHKLGCGQLLLTLAISVYIGTSCLWHLGYVDFRTPTNTVRLTLQQPVLNHCNPNNNSCKDDFPRTSELDYCCTRHCSDIPEQGGMCTCPGRSLANYRCAYLDGPSASFESGNSMAVTTCFVQYMQNRSDAWQTWTDKVWMNSLPPATSFVAGIERFTMLIDHAVTLAAFGIHEVASDMSGLLHVDGNTTIGNTTIQHLLCRRRSDAVSSPDDAGSKTDAAPCYLKPSQRLPIGDVFEVGTMLEAMGIDLEGNSSSRSSTLRYRGFTVALQIEYSNTRPWSFRSLLREQGGVLPNVSYVYRFLPQPQNSYKRTSIEPRRPRTLDGLEYATERVKTDARGIYFTVVVAGRLGQFSLRTLLVTLTTSVGLLGFSEFVVRKLATRMGYERHLQEEIGEIGQLRARELDEPLVGLA